jgi:beta-N-acetylhexosaminidase
VKKLFLSIIAVVVIGTQFLPIPNSIAAPVGQVFTPQEKASVLLKEMTPEEKIGQLFLVTFQGTDISQESQIYDLIVNHHIGGVVLRTDNNNFVGPEGTATAVQELIRAIQTANWQSTRLNLNNPTPTAAQNQNYIPLLIGISQEGDLSPFDQIINNLTPLPSEMAIGATWKTKNAEMVGSILGQELQALGFNLLFGPSLDVLDVVRTDTGEDLGVRTFGGDPYWVAEMGKAFIKGVHTGSNNRISVIAKHFPGRGESDRQPEDEVATVRKSLEQLKQIELAPFFAVTQNTDDQSTTTDGLLLSHIRYQGFQGNIRATTRPVSFDSAALDQILALPEFSQWRELGGIIVSDDLGSKAVRKFFDPLNLNFDARQVVKSALLAGNDLLYLGNINATGDVDSYSTVVRTLDFFVQKYLEDSAFQQRVDEAALRVLSLKFKLYPQFVLANILPDTAELEILDTSEQQIFEIARESVTLVSPDPIDVASVLPSPPQLDERIVFISNKITQQQCTTCEGQEIFLAEKLKNAVERLYGPKAGEQIQSFRLSAYSYEDLRLLLEKDASSETLLSDLSSADWIVISFTEFQKNSPELAIFQRLFSEQPELTRNKKIIGFAFNAPYFPDATDITKFTAYYAIYSKIPVYVDVAARILFQEITPTGVLPVSVLSIGYDLITATTPDPAQIIPLFVTSVAEGVSTTETPSTGIEQPLIYKVGDSLPLQTGIIIDHNGNPVPDGTIVRFLIDTNSASGSVEQIETQTLAGVAQTTYRIQNLGVVELKVTSDPAQTSRILRLDITDAGGVITSIEPTFSPTENFKSTVTPVITPTPQSSNTQTHNEGNPTILDWTLSTLLVVTLSLSLYWWGWRRRANHWNPKVPFFSGMLGYAGYLYFALKLPGSTEIVQKGGLSIILLVVFLCCMLGWGIGYLLYRMERVKNKRA